MNAFTKLTVAALTAAGIAGGVAVAQTTTPASPIVDGRTDTANYGTPAGAPLKRDGSLQGDAVARPAADDAAVTTTTTTTDTSSTAATPVAPASTDMSADNTADASLQPRADRN
jgi:hypothetical protein